MALTQFPPPLLDLYVYYRVQAEYIYSICNYKRKNLAEKSYFIIRLQNGSLNLSS